MEQRYLGQTGVSVSSLCLGAMMFGAWGNTDHEDSIRNHPRRARRRDQLHRHGRRLPISTKSTAPTRIPTSMRR
jgi:hypothetical protein